MLPKNPSPHNAWPHGQQKGTYPNFTI